MTDYRNGAFRNVSCAEQQEQPEGKKQKYRIIVM